MNTKPAFRTIVISLVCLSLSILLLWLIDSLLENIVLKTLLSTILSNAIIIIVVNVIWELFAKKALISEMMDMTKLSNAFSSSGIKSVDMDFQSINWDNVLNSSNQLTIFMVYGRTWRKHNQTAINKFINNKNKKLTIILPNLKDEALMREFDRRFGYTKGETKELIQGCINSFKDKETVKIFLYDNTFTSSYYLTENEAYMSFFRHSKSGNNVPVITAINNKNGFYDFVRQEIETIKQNSKEYKKTQKGI